MNINATLLVQMIDFGIVYWVLRVLVLKPAYALIMDERRVKASLDAAIRNEQERTALLQEKRYQLWHNGHRFFIHETSQTIPELLIPPSHITAPSQSSQQELVHDAATVQDVLVAYLKECK